MIQAYHTTVNTMVAKKTTEWTCMVVHLKATDRDLQVQHVTTKTGGWGVGASCLHVNKNSLIAQFFIYL